MSPNSYKIQLTPAKPQLRLAENTKGSTHSSSEWAGNGSRGSRVGKRELEQRLYTKTHTRYIVLLPTHNIPARIFNSRAPWLFAQEESIRERVYMYSKHPTSLPNNHHHHHNHHPEKPSHYVQLIIGKMNFPFNTFIKAIASKLTSHWKYLLNNFCAVLFGKHFIPLLTFNCTEKKVLKRHALKLGSLNHTCVILTLDITLYWVKVTRRSLEIIQKLKFILWFLNINNLPQIFRKLTPTFY